MATAMSQAQLRRLSDVALVQRMCATHADEAIGLARIADACRRRARSHAARDFYQTRNALLTIACEWDLARDRLEDQSDACLALIAGFLSS